MAARDLLDDATVTRHLAELDGWSRAGQSITKDFTFDGFPAAVAFVSRLVQPSEAADHHPDLAIHYKTVTVTFSTHSVGGLTGLDFAGARSADAAARS